ncbi:MAG: RNA polymerase sigma factor [Acidobacteria bacterium]|nr:RNA polymerase sigma factor [Acidobacteriota bacterium]MBU4307089.1 RNA polymerase sigma factor [Acidobacteriota bacterium]MBU4404299.1 RNA polymerase sigma factor [Acidobacteriota bacterium]MCG2812612.1 RNA polymerase sigma factor [Candidatus Aminicenantes bacterium]
MDQQTLTDDEIVTAVLAGRRQDFEILVRRYSGKIIHFITRMTQDRDEAQSIAQEVFLKIFQNLPYYRKENNFSAFIFKIAKNMTLNWLNREKRTILFSRLLGREFNKAPFRQEPPRVSPQDQKERESEITRNLLLLAEEQRLALILKVYLEFSYKQIREITGWSIPKIETLISRAKSRLKKNILLQERSHEVVYTARKK